MHYIIRKMQLDYQHKSMWTINYIIFVYKTHYIENYINRKYLIGP